MFNLKDSYSKFNMMVIKLNFMLTLVIKNLGSIWNIESIKIILSLDNKDLCSKWKINLGFKEYMLF